MGIDKNSHSLPERVRIAHGKGRLMVIVLLLRILLCHPLETAASESLSSAHPASNAASVNGTQPAAGAQVERAFYILEYRVEGAHCLKAIEVEEAVYPFLGPGRTADDVEQARAALEQAYRNKGYQTVAVQVPPQQARGGVIVLQVVEGTVGRLRVRGSRYFSPDQIKKGIPSLAEGRVPNFNEVTRDIVGLNQLPDRRVTPLLRAGSDPGTVDIDLNVKETLPLHGSVELNNRYSANTTELRLNGSVSYNNLWQLGHSAGFSFQVAPEHLDDAKVFSAYYLARFPDVNWLGLMLQGTDQESNVSTLGGANVAGRGQVIGLRAIVTLLAMKEFFHSISFGIDCKHFDQNVTVGNTKTVAPITYFPLSAVYGATWLGKGYETDLNAGVNLHLRGTGSGPAAFDAKRFKGDGGYLYFRGDLSHAHDLPVGFQIFGKVQGQIANEPLLDSEEFSGGGLGTARGYLESEVVGDNALLGSLELRSPSLNHWCEKALNEWRVYVFFDGGTLTINDPLPEQASYFNLASYGVGSRLRFRDHFNGSVDVGIPLISQSPTKAHDLLLTFRLWGDF